MFVNRIYPGKFLKTSFVSPGKPWNLVFASPGKSWKTVFTVCTNPAASSVCYDSWHPLCSIYMFDSLSTISVQVFFSLPLGLVPSTLYFMHFFTQSPRLCHLILVYASTPYFATHPSYHSHICPPKYRLIFLSYEPGLTSMQHTTLSTTAVQSPSHYQ